MKPLAVKAIVIALASVGLGSLPAGMAWANPQGGTVVAGNVAFEQESATKLGITQTSNKAIVDWRSFSIGASEHTQIYQPSSSAVILNRVVGDDPSKILGRLTANGQVFLVNPNGIVFGKDAQIDVAGLVASTHNIRNEDFLAGRYDFNQPGKPDAAVINEGSIRIADTGIAAFVAPSVANRGVIVARLGKIALGAANGFTLDLQGDQLLNFMVSDEVAQTAFDTEGRQLTSFVENAGRIEADGGHVLLTAKAAEGVVHSVINMSGTIEARTVNNRKGEILLLGGRHGTVEISGRLDASARDGGDGGFIETSGADVRIADSTQVTTAAPYGKTGNWLIDPNDYTIAASGGNISGTTLSNNLANTAVTISTATQGTPGGNGDIFVNDGVNWSSHTLTLNAERDININAVMDATGTAGLAMNTGGNGTVNVGFNSDGSFKGKANLGSGTNLTINGTPYIIIRDVNALQAMQDNVSGHYALGNDIDASQTSSWNMGLGFHSIGNDFGSFTGIFNGLGHVVDKLTISNSEVRVGFFGNSGGTVQNIGLTDIYVSAGSTVGGLVGNNWGTISNSYVAGIVIGTGVGGLAGTSAGTIINSHSSGSVQGNGAAGGLVGSISDTDSDHQSSIIDSYSTSAVIGTTHVGGLVGSSWGAGSTIIRTYSTGAVIGSDRVGGLIGRIVGSWISNSYSSSAVSGSSQVGGVVGNNDGGVINYCYSTGAISGNNYVGGLVGLTYGYGTSNSYWDTQTSGQANSAAGTGLTTTQMKTMSSFSGWDIANTPGTGSVWYINEGASYPLLNAFNTALAIAPTPTPIPIQNPGATSSPIPSQYDLQPQWQADYATHLVPTNTAGSTPLSGQFVSPSSDLLTEMRSGVSIGASLLGIPLVGMIQNLVYPGITPKQARTALPYALLADAAYGLQGNQGDYLLIDSLVDPISGFQAGAYKNQVTGELVIAYAGSNDIFDFAVSDPSTLSGNGLMSDQYKYAEQFFEKIAKDNNTSNIVVTGHSLGGALAQYVGAVEAAEAYAFNPLGVPSDLVSHRDIDGNNSNIQVIRSFHDVASSAVAGYSAHLTNNVRVVVNGGAHGLDPLIDAIEIMVAVPSGGGGGGSW